MTQPVEWSKAKPYVPGHGFRSGIWYTQDGPASDGGGLTFGLNAAYFIPITVSKRTRFVTLAHEIVTGVATAIGRYACYADDGSYGPGALIQDFGTIDLSPASGIVTKAIDLTLDNGIYWFAYVPQVASSSMRSRTPINAFIGYNGAQNANPTGVIATVGGAFPASIVGQTSFVQSGMPKIQLQVA